MICDGCGGEMHLCAPLTPVDAAQLEFVGCASNGRSHPDGRNWICLFCDVKVAADA